MKDHVNNVPRQTKYLLLRKTQIELDDEIGDAKARRHRKHIEEIRNQNSEIEIE